MTGSRMFLLFAVLIVLTALAVEFSFRARIGLKLMQMAASRVAAQDRLGGLENGLHVVLCGSGSPAPDPARAGPCTMIIAGQNIFIVDVGDGSTRNIARSGIPLEKLEAVFITHFHSDHIDGLGALMALRQNTLLEAVSLPVIGPVGVERVVFGFNRAYSLNGGYRAVKAGVSSNVFTPEEPGRARPFRILERPGEPGVRIWSRGGLKITAFPVDHRPVSPAVGYRFDYAGRSVVLSGDTRATAGLVKYAKGADILIHEALQPEMIESMAAALDARGRQQQARRLRKVRTYHSSPAQAAAVARRANVKFLVLNHLGPALPSRYFRPAFLNGALNEFEGEIILGEDGLMFSLPANVSEIRQRRLF